MKIFLRSILIATLMLFSQLLFANPKNPLLIFTYGKGSVMQNISFLVIKEAYQSLGIEIKSKGLPLARALAESNRGNFDGEISRIKGIDKKFTNLMPIPIKVNIFQAYAFTQNNQLNIENWQSLQGLNVVSMSGVKFVEKNAKKYNLAYTATNSIGEALQLVSKGRADVAIFPNVVALNVMKKEGITNVSATGKPLASHNLYHYLNKKHINLVDKLTVILAKMQYSGRTLEIRNQYLLALNQ